MSDNNQIIELYTDLAQNPKKDFGWDKGLKNAKAHGYKQEWIDKIPSNIWEFCAAVGNPFKNSEIKKGDTILDLGCGAGVDVLVASLLVGENGKVFGVDITPKMVEVATIHAKEINANNVNILQSGFDSVTLEDETVDVVISNGAINLTSCKESVFAEIYRVLKPNGKIFFADMIDVSIDEGSCCTIEQSSCCTPSKEEDWANCVAGTMRESELVALIQKAGFKDVKCTGHTHYSTSDTTKGATFKASKIPANEIREKHWDTIFQNSDYKKVLWHQKHPNQSLSLIQKYSSDNSNVLDAGCGTSHLVDNLLQENYINITLLDTSKTSLNIVKERISNDSIELICNDILNFESEKKFDIWHDRAVFHFLLTKKEREQYFKVLHSSLNKDGIAIVSTFAIDGEIKCAGLDVIQYDAKKISQELPAELQLLESEEFLHHTPKETTQNYISFVIKKL